MVLLEILIFHIYATSSFWGTGRFFFQKTKHNDPKSK